MSSKFINIHLSNDIASHDERFDTLISPNGTVASLEAIELRHGISPDNIISFDGASYANAEETFERVKNAIGETRSTIFMTVLLYNAEPTLTFAAKLKSYFGDSIHIILGGQLTSYHDWANNHPYLHNSSIDAVATGDAEAIIPQIIRDLETNTLQRLYRDKIHDGLFSIFSYDHFADLDSRFSAMQEVAGFRQLCVQGAGGPGCSWAVTQGKACSFCALQNIGTMNRLPLDDYFAFERSLQDKFGFTEHDRFFAVDNQFIPVMGTSKQIEWLKAYINSRNKYEIVVPKYAYLTVNSIDKERAQLLKEAGITEVYLGVDHFDKGALVEEGKPFKDKAILYRCLRSLEDVGITARIGLVLGAAVESQKTFDNVKSGLTEVLEKFPNTIKTVGVFPIELLPGSETFEEMKVLIAKDASAQEARQILKTFDAVGYLSRKQQKKLQDYFITKHSSLSLEEFSSGVREVQDIVKAHHKVTYSVDTSPNRDILKGS